MSRLEVALRMTVDLGRVADIFRPQADFLVTDPAYSALAESALQPGEAIGLASRGRVNTDFLNNQGSPGWDAGILVTDQRLLFLRPPSKSMFGKIKQSPPVTLSYQTVFDAGIVRALPNIVAVNVNDNFIYKIWALHLGEENFARVFKEAIKEQAEVHGGVNNRPPGV